MSDSTGKDGWHEPDNTNDQEHSIGEVHYFRKQEGSSPPAVWSALQVILDYARRGKGEAEHHLRVLLADAETCPEVTAFLTSRVEKQDHFAFELLYKHYEPEIKIYITRMIGSGELAEDLTPEVFSRAWQSLSKRTSQREMHFRPYLYKIASHLVIDHYRSEKRHLLPSSISSIVEEGEQLFGSIRQADEPEMVICERERIQMAFQQISPAIRAEFVMHVIYGFTSREIAIELGKPEGTVSSHIARARAQFRRAYEQ